MHAEHAGDTEEGNGLEAGVLGPWYTAEADPGTTVMHRERFTHGPTTALRRIEYVAPPKLTTEAFPYLLSPIS